MNARLDLNAAQATELLRLMLAENAELRARIEEPRYVAGRDCVVCGVGLREGMKWDPMHHECAPTIMTPALRRDVEQLLAALRARGDLGRGLRVRVDRVATSIGAQP